MRRMRDPRNVFHQAIPTHDLDAATRWYTEVLGCRLARRYDDRVTFDFFGDQLVCHLDPDEVVAKPKMYPRHFGVTFRDEAEYLDVLERAQARGARFFKAPFTRFKGRREAHSTFLLVDPSNNLVEFKHYADPEMMY